MYDPAGLWPLTGSIEGEANGWIYVNNEDSLGTITSIGFLATGGEMGMKVGDLVWVINQVTPTSTVCQCTQVATGGALHLPTSATITAQPGPPGGAVNSVSPGDGSLTITPTTGAVVAKIANTTVAPGSYTNTNLTIGPDGRVTRASNGVGLTGTPSALTKTDDANVTLTLGGTPATALLQPASITVGWSGTLPVNRGGTGAGTLALDGILYGNGTGAIQALPVNASATRKFLTQASSAAPALNTIAAGDIPATTVTPGSYTNTGLTVGQDGRITAAANGASSVANAISAGVYDNTGALVRTLWSNRPQTLSAASWDGRNDDASTAAAGTYTIKGLTGNVTYTWDGVVGNTNYSSVSTPTQDPRLFQAQDCIYSMAISAAGVMYFCTGYNEARVSTFKALAATPQACTYISYNASLPNTITFHPLAPVTTKVVTDGTNVYWAGNNPATRDTGIFATLCSNDHPVTTFSGTGVATVTWLAGSFVVCDHLLSELTTNAPTAAGNATLHFAATVPAWVVAGLVVTDLTGGAISANTTVLSTTATTVVLSANATGGGVATSSTIGFHTSDNANSITFAGLAVQQTKPFSAGSVGYLFVTRTSLGVVDVMDKTTGALVQSVAIAGAAALCCDTTDGFLWVVHGTSATKYTINSDGTLTTTGVSVSGTGTPFSIPLAIGVTTDNATVVIVDGGTSQQVKGYSQTTGAFSWSLGTAGGYATDATVSNTKFMFNDPGTITTSGQQFYLNPLSYICFVPNSVLSPNGSFWFGDPGNARNMHFASDHATFVDQIAWLPSAYSCNLCTTDPTRLFIMGLEFAIDYTKPFNPTSGAWTLKRNWSYGTDTASVGFNVDWAFSGLQFPTTMGGRTYAMTLSLGGASFGSMILWELVSGGILRNTTLVLSRLNNSINPDGAQTQITPYAAGSGSQMTWTRSAFTGLDGSFNPTWGAGVVVAMSPVLGDNDPGIYTSGAGNVVPTTGGVYPVYDGRVENNGPPFHRGYHLGGVNAANNWVFKTAPSTPPYFGVETFNGQNSFPADGYFTTTNVVNAAGPVLVAGTNIIYGYYGEGWIGVGSGPETNKWRHYHESGLLVGEFGVIGDRIVNPTTGLISDINNVLGMAGNAFGGGFAIVNTGGVNTGYLYHNDEGFKAGLHRWRIDGLGTLKINSISYTFAGTPTPIVANPQDMLAGLPISTTVPNNTAGWTRTPVFDIIDTVSGPTGNWWTVTTNVTQYNVSPVDNVSPDIACSFSSSGAATPGQLLGGPITSANFLATAWTGITSGSFTVVVDGGSHNVTGLNFAGVGNMFGVAAVINTAVAAFGTFIFDNNYKRFEFTSLTTGITSSVSFLTVGGGGTDITNMLAMRSGTVGASSQAGFAAMTDASVTRQLPSVFTQGWKLNMILQIAGLLVANTSYVHIEVADANGLIIAQLVTEATLVKISNGNSFTTFVDGSSNAQACINVIQFPQPLIIEYVPEIAVPYPPSVGALLVTYAGTGPTALAPKDPLANAAVPATLKVIFHAQIGSFGANVAVDLSQILLQ